MEVVRTSVILSGLSSLPAFPPGDSSLDVYLNTLLWAVFLTDILQPPHANCLRDTVSLLVETFPLSHFHVLFPCVRESSDLF